MYEFHKANKNCYSYRCEEWKKCLGKWYIYERDVAGYGIEHAAHSFEKSYHKSIQGTAKVAKTALNIMPLLDMRG